MDQTPRRAAHPSLPPLVIAVRKGPYTAPVGASLRDPLTFQRSEVLSAEEAKGWPLWAKVALWVGIGWVVAGAIAGAVLSS